jgi:predicted flap endonuclease-1-like 5' DNA nuclease
LHASLAIAPHACPALPETFNALLLAKSLRQRLWIDSQLETRQLAGIGPLIAQRLAAAGVNKLRQLAEVDPRRLEALAQRHYPFGGCWVPPLPSMCISIFLTQI